MLRVYPEQLRTQLNEGLRAAYLLLGNDPFLLQESQDAILQIAATHGFNEHHTIQIDNNIDWKATFSLCQEISLFSTRQTLMLILPGKGSNAEINRQLATLVGLLHSDLLLIVCGNKLTKIQESAAWFIKLASQAVLVKCQTPEKEQLLKWVITRARQYNLQLDEQACQLLCYCYEGNLLALMQALDRLSLLWPDGKLTLPRVEKAVNDAAYFTPFHWIDALLAAKSKHALRVLQQLRLKGIAPFILLHMLQHELILLIIFKRQSAIVPLRVLFDKYRVWQNRRALTTKIINRLDHDQLRQAVHILTRIELTLKQDHDQLVWNKLESLSLFLCHKTPTDIFIND